MGTCTIWFTTKIILVSFDSYSKFVLDPLSISIACPSCSCLCTHFYISSVHKILFYAILFLCRTTNSSSPSSSSKPYQTIFVILECFSINLSTREDENFVVLLPTNLMFPSPVLHCSQYFVTCHCRVEQRWCHSGCRSWRACAWRSRSTWLVLWSQIRPQT